MKTNELEILEKDLKNAKTEDEIQKIKNKISDVERGSAIIDHLKDQN